MISPTEHTALTIFRRPNNFEELCAIIDNVLTREALDEAIQYATDIARKEGYPDPVAQAESWLESTPYCNLQKGD